MKNKKILDFTHPSFDFVEEYLEDWDDLLLDTVEKINLEQVRVSADIDPNSSKINLQFQTNDAQSFKGLCEMLKQFQEIAQEILSEARSEGRTCSCGAKFPKFKNKLGDEKIKILGQD